MDDSSPNLRGLLKMLTLPGYYNSLSPKTELGKAGLSAEEIGRLTQSTGTLEDFLKQACCGADAISRVRGAIVDGALLKKTIAKSIVRKQRLQFFCPVCPDYSMRYALRCGISPSARQGMEYAKAFSAGLQEAGIDAEFCILIADTEDDLPEVLARLTNGNLAEFSRRCRSTSDSINGALVNQQNMYASAFSDYFGPAFRHQQYIYEKQIHDGGLFAKFVEHTSKTRQNKYKEILGRDERQGELTIRYAAQYAALSTLLRQKFGEDKLVIINYPSPNIQFFNPPRLTMLDKNATNPILVVECGGSK